MYSPEFSVSSLLMCDDGAHRYPRHPRYRIHSSMTTGHVCQINPVAIAQAAIAPDIERLEIELTHDRESALHGKAGVLLPVQQPFGTVIDVDVIDIRLLRSRGLTRWQGFSS